MRLPCGSSKSRQLQTAYVSVLITSETEMQLIFLCFSNYESYSAVCRPWITIDGTTSQQLLRMFKDMVLMLILNNPGFSEVSRKLKWRERYKTLLSRRVINS